MHKPQGLYKTPYLPWSSQSNPSLHKLWENTGSFIWGAEDILTGNKMKDSNKYRIVRTSNGDIYQRLWKGITINWSQHQGGYHNVDVPTQWRTLNPIKNAKKICEIKSCSAVQLVFDKSFTQKLETL